MNFPRPRPEHAGADYERLCEIAAMRGLAVELHAGGNPHVVNALLVTIPGDTGRGPVSVQATTLAGLPLAAKYAIGDITKGKGRAR